MNKILQTIKNTKNYLGSVFFYFLIAFAAILTAGIIKGPPLAIIAHNICAAGGKLLRHHEKNIAYQGCIKDKDTCASIESHLNWMEDTHNRQGIEWSCK